MGGQNRGLGSSNGGECEGCRRLKARFLVLCVLSGFVGSIGVFWGLGSYGCRGRDLWEERAQVLVEQSNLSKNQLQALVLLLSSSEVLRFFWCVLLLASYKSTIFVLLDFV